MSSSLVPLALSTPKPLKVRPLRFSALTLLPSSVIAIAVPVVGSHATGIGLLPTPAAAPLPKTPPEPPIAEPAPAALAPSPAAAPEPPPGKELPPEPTASPPLAEEPPWLAPLLLPAAPPEEVTGWLTVEPLPHETVSHTRPISARTVIEHSRKRALERSRWGERLAYAITVYCRESAHCVKFSASPQLF